MALHGEIKINGGDIASWSAQRLEDLKDLEQVSLYHCWYETYTGQYVEDFTYATIEHRYSDGAAVLAQKVLQLAEGGWGS